MSHSLLRRIRARLGFYAYTHTHTLAPSVQMVHGDGFVLCYLNR